ncbi:FCD domain-containing protein [Roseobacter sp. HKCCD9010]|uniref:GntR family transcriptional regulator n=1 Tax=unclassified Roseobacter TaxID=196798 RepID=UPI001491076C|nr:MULTISPECIES: GntR family transcriptional regulator [unclassified Roseobacter]MBF9051154.1 FCD domain-containing protein [Rhodobacterales bacterium HKCCD4356]NNV12923.1 FCD domain-containing protein [Roseobacter sp. HKCCD7357]NNV16868.1 FCD domain-containing protein [Roseobacter sp. HKCCD8768]NNV26500.1 FCD domain-containing protein [Roseobacter sp. HKCCD8192]NNV30589.1 FCD domain-containing protein [Roseobacter sp. HKCCD9061]
MSRISAYESFRDRLFAGDLKPGQFVTQRELAELAGVSLGSAREAIQRLEHDSLLKVHPQRGIQVADVTLRFIREAFQLRSILELAAIPDYCEFHQDKAEATLRDTNDVLQRAQKEASAEVLSQAVDVDWRFHDELVGAINNELVEETYQINAVRLRLIRTNIRLSAKRVFGALEEHIAILEACARGDAEAAQSKLSDHLSVAMQRAMEGI